ncbi:MAG: TnpV protein [Oscillospiraceae bacterium]
MEKSTFEQVGGTYRWEGDYLLPNLTVPESVPVGIWGQRRKQYLREHRKALYTAMLLSEELENHLTEIDQQAEEMFSQLVKQMAAQEGITEQLKADSQMEWVGCMNNIRERVTEIIDAELILVKSYQRGTR